MGTTKLGASSIVGAVENQNLIELFTRLLAYAMIAAGALCIVFIFIGGITFILSGNQEDKIKQAMGTIRYAIFGFFISIFSVFIVSILGKTIGIDVVKYVSIDEIYGLVQQLTNQDAPKGSIIDSLE